MSVLDCAQIMEILPHRPPFLLVDRILELEEGRRAVGIKNVSMADPWLTGHFPGRPVMPGVLIVEALAQVGAVAVLKMPQFAGKIAYFAGIDGVRFRRPVVPGDCLRLEVEIVKLRGRAGKGYGVAYVGGEAACEAEILFAIG